MSDQENESANDEREATAIKAEPKVSGRPVQNTKRSGFRLDMVVVGLLLIGFGAMLLYSSFNPDFQFSRLVMTWWPLLFVAAGLIKILQAIIGAPGKGSGIGWLIFAGIILFLASGVHWDWIDDPDINFRFFGLSPDFSVAKSEESIDVGNADTLALDVNRTRVTIEPTGRGEIEAIQRVYVRGWGNRDVEREAGKIELEYSRLGDRITITSHPERYVSEEGRVRIEIQLRVPRTLAIDYRGTSSRLIAKRMQGAINVVNSRGDIDIIDAEGPVSIDAENGDIDLSNLSAGLIVRGSRLSLDLEDVYGAIDIDTQRTGIELQNVRRLDGDVSIVTTRGSIELELDRASDFELDCRAESGKVYVDFDSVDIEERGSYTARFGSGGYRVTLRSSGGSVSLDES